MTAEVGRRTAYAAALLLFLARGSALADDAPSIRQAVPRAVGSDAQDPWLDKAWAVVHEAPKDVADAVLARRIGALGAPAIPAVFSIYEGHGGDFRAPVRSATLLAAFRAFPSADVVAFLRSKAAADELSADAVVKIAQVAGAVAGQDCVKTVLAAASRLTAADLRSPTLCAVLGASIESSLKGDPAGWTALRLAWPTLDPALRVVALSAAERTKSTQAFAFLADLVGHDPKVNAQALACMCRMPRLRARPLGGDAVGRIRWLTSDRDPAVRAAAILMVGILREPDAFDAALALVGDPDATVVEASLATLRRVCGADLPADLDAWKQWRAADEEWTKSSLAGEIALLESADEAIVVATLASLGGRPLHAAETARPVAARLDSPSASVRRAACQALGTLRDAESIGALVGALSDADAGVAKAAGAALVAVTGLNLPADADAWRAAVR